MSKKLFFCCPQTEKMVKDVFFDFPRNGKDTLIVGSISWEKFPNGHPNFRINSVNEIKGADVYFFASFDTSADITEQLYIINAIPRYESKSLTVILPFFPTATDDRIDESGHIATAKGLARMLSGIPMSANGPAKIMFFDEHIKGLRFYFEDTVIPVPLSAMSLAITGLRNYIGTPNVCFPDAGAKKRFGKTFEEFQQILCEKTRLENGKKIVRIKEGDPKEKKVIIIDDLTMSGGTLDECRNALVDAGAYTVDVFIVHGAFDNDDIWKGLVYSDYDPTKHFHNFIMTDSCPVMTKKIAAHRPNKPFKILSLAKLICEAIKE
jgi:phosphoribosylpyrophosphate synthetase